jgi:two-component system chemotaxis response regulator CheY
MHKVLVIDDDAFVRSTIKAPLDADGRFSVLEAAEGREGLRVATREQPDVDMPQMDGLTMLRGMRRRPRTETTPVVMITGGRSEETMAPGHGRTRRAVHHQAVQPRQSPGKDQPGCGPAPEAVLTTPPVSGSCPACAVYR